MQMPTPGWYPDPSSPSGTRYWDGAAWTDHTAAPTPPPPQPAWGEQPAASTQWGPAPAFTVEPASASSRSVLGLVLVLLLVAGLLAGGVIAAILVARSDSSTDRTPANTETEVPTTRATADGGDPAGVAADVQSCEVERATMTTAVEAAKVSSQASSDIETPDAFLNDPASFRYYTWTGSSPEDWALQPIGTPPC